MAVAQRGLDQPTQNRRQLVDTAPAKHVGRQSRELLRRLVEDADPIPGSYRDDPALDGRQGFLQLLVDLNHALVRLRIADRHRGLVRERLKQVGVIGEVGAARALWPEDDQPEQASFREKRRGDVGVETNHVGLAARIPTGQLVAKDECLHRCGSTRQR